MKMEMEMEKRCGGEGENMRREQREERRQGMKGNGYHVNYFDTQTEQPFQVDVSRARCNAILHLTCLSSLYSTSAHTHIQAVWVDVKHTFRMCVCVGWGGSNRRKKHLKYMKR